MNKNTEMGNKLWYVVLSLIASILSIVVFITGRNLPDYEKEGDTPIVAATYTSTATHYPETIPLTPTNTSSPTNITETTPTISSKVNDWSGILSVRMPTLNEIRAEAPVSLWDENLIDVRDMYAEGIASYSGKASVNAKYLLPVYWCALSPKLLEENMNSIMTEFFVNDEKIPEKYIFTYNYDTNTNWHCNYHAVILSDWTKGVQYTLDIRRTIKTNLSDGQSNYSSGEYIYRLVITVH